MRKTNKNLTKQILTLMLAFIMVFTGMGIGSWGVDTAWADENNTSTISNLTSENLGNPIGTHNESSVYYVKTAVKKLTMESTFGDENVVFYIDPNDDLGGEDGENLVEVHSLAGTYFIQKDSKEYKAAVQSYEKNAKPDFKDFFTSEIEADYLFVLMYYEKSETFGYLIIEWNKETVSADKENLKDKLTKANAIDNERVYQSDDRYNGKKESKIGFYAEMRDIIKAAQAVYDDKDATQKQVDDAAATLDQSNPNSELSKAIANLIPKSQLNATNLYEVIQECKKNYPDDYLEFFTQATAKNLKAALADAEKYLALLFNEEATEKNPNGANRTENVFTNQGKADGYAKALNTARSEILPLDAFAKAQDDASLIQALAKRFSMTENNGKYTEKSWNAFTSAREKALTYAATHPLTKDSTSSEVAGYEEHRKAFSQAAYGLISKTENNRISVSLVFTDDYLLRNRKRQTMRTYANFKKYERMLLTVIAKTSRCYHRKEHSL